MTPLTALAVLLVATFVLLWLTQTAVLLASGERLAPLLRYQTDKRLVVVTMKIMVQLGWLLIIVGYPLLLGEYPVAFYQAAFASPAPWRPMLLMVLATITGFALINLIHYQFNAIGFSMRFSAAKTRRRILGCFLTPIPLAILVEAVFRGVVLHALLNQLTGLSGTVVAIVLSSLLFSLVHFVRKRDERRKPVLQPAIGLFFVGVVLGTAYVAGGLTLWLPVATHAAGILATELPRSFVEYKAAPRWIGYRSFPHSGPLGIVLMLFLTWLVWQLTH